MKRKRIEGLQAEREGLFSSIGIARRRNVWDERIGRSLITTPKKWGRERRDLCLS